MDLINTYVKNNKIINEKIFDIIEDNIENFVEEIDNVKLLENIITIAKDKYFNDSQVLTDYTYDKLIDKLSIISPNSKVLTDIGYKVDSINKVELPYHMGSMTKIKKDNPQLLNQWLTKYSGPFIVSNKLDGVSVMLIVDKNENINLYTRGDGTVGTNISHLIKHLNIKHMKNIITYVKKKGLNKIFLRGEMIMKTKTFIDKYSDIGANPRNFVSGQVNAKKINISILNDIDILFYEIIEPWLTIDNQYNVLTSLFLSVSPFELFTKEKISVNNLSDILINRKNISEYEIDGLIISDINYHDRNIDKNPEYSFAFKQDGEMVIATVEYVEWNVSKHGYLKPRIKILPVHIGGVEINYVTANNAKFVKDNKIGKGAKIKLIRSGDVIPKIIGIIEPAKEVQLPGNEYGKWIWTESGVDIYLTEPELTENQLIKILSFFTKSLGIKNIDESTFTSLVDNGLIESLSDIFYLKKSDLLKLDGFQEKKTNKILEELENGFKKMHLVDLMVASGMFGRGLGEKKIRKIYKIYPDIMLQSYKNKEELIKIIDDIEGFDDITARQFVENMDEFNEFFQLVPKQIRERLILDTIPNKEKINKKNKINGMKFIFTGFRDKEIEKLITENGGEISSSVSKNTNVLFCKDEDLNEGTNSKLIKAKELGILIVKKSDMKKFLNNLGLVFNAIMDI